MDKIEAQKEAQAAPLEDKLTSKKPFVEPEISVPVDVLEATTFQQPVTTGSTNP